MNRTLIAFVALALLAACGRTPVSQRAYPSVASETPTASSSSSDEPQPYGAHSPLPKAPNPTPKGPPPKSFVAITREGAIVVKDSASGRTTRTIVSEADTRGKAFGLSLALGGTILYYSQGDKDDCPTVMRVPLEGGTPRAIVEGSFGAVSPDGKKLAWSTHGCRRDPQQLLVRTLASGETRSWTDTSDFRGFSGLSFWDNDSRHIFTIECGVDSCGPDRVDSLSTSDALESNGPKIDELDGECCIGWSPILRGDNFVATIDWPVVGGGERWPLIQVDRSGKIYEVASDGRAYALHDFDRNGDHMLTNYRDHLMVWTAGTMRSIGQGVKEALWIE